MKLTDKQRENLAKTFLDVFKYLIIGLFISDFVFKAALPLRVIVAFATIGSLIIGTILDR